MQLEAGKILEGKVTGITKFGAFVELEPGKVGMVHISEISTTYVNDINDVLTMGQMVKVKILNVGDDGKISLSIKKAQKPAPRREGGNPNFHRDNNGQNRSGGKPYRGNGPQNKEGGQSSNRSFGNRPGNGGSRSGSPRQSGSSNSYSGGAPQNYYPPQPKGPASFEDMLSKFMASSDEKISGLKKEHAVSRKAGQKRR